MKCTIYAVVAWLILSNMALGQINAINTTSGNDTTANSSTFPELQSYNHEPPSPAFFFGIALTNWGQFDLAKIEALSGEFYAQRAPGVSIYGGGFYKQIEWEVAYHSYQSVFIEGLDLSDRFRFGSQEVSGNDAREPILSYTGLGFAAKYNFQASNIGAFFVKAGLNTITPYIDLNEGYSDNLFTVGDLQWFMLGSIGYKLNLPGQSKIILESTIFHTNDDLDQNAVSVGYAYYFPNYW